MRRAVKGRLSLKRPPPARKNPNPIRNIIRKEDKDMDSLLGLENMRRAVKLRVIKIIQEISLKLLT